MDGFMVMADILCKLYLYSCILMVTHYFTYDTIDNKEENYCRDYKPIKDYLNATKQSINPVILIIILYKPLHPLFQVN